MSDDKIAEIRERHSKRSEIDQSGAYKLDGFTYHGSLSQSQEDVDTLLAEVYRLREVIRTIRARCVELDDSDAVSEVLDISSTALGDEP